MQINITAKNISFHTLLSEKTTKNNNENTASSTTSSPTSSDSKKATENEKKHPELMNKLQEVKQELKALQKQYNEYT